MAKSSLSEDLQNLLLSLYSPSQISSSVVILSTELHCLMLVVEIFTQSLDLQNLLPIIQKKIRFYLKYLVMLPLDLQYLKLSSYNPISSTKMSRYTSSDILSVMVISPLMLMLPKVKPRSILDLVIYLQYQMQRSRKLSIMSEILSSLLLVLRSRRIQNLMLDLVHSLHLSEQQSLLLSTQQIKLLMFKFLAQQQSEALPEKLDLVICLDLEGHPSLEQLHITTLQHLRSLDLHKTKYPSLMLQLEISMFLVRHLFRSKEVLILVLPISTFMMQHQIELLRYLLAKQLSRQVAMLSPQEFKDTVLQAAQIFLVLQVFLLRHHIVEEEYYSVLATY